MPTTPKSEPTPDLIEGSAQTEDLPVIEARGLAVTLGSGSDAFRMQIKELVLNRGEHAACIGPSGCGKTTLLRALAGILRPERGEIRINGRNITEMTDSQRRAFRATSIGMVFQHFALIDYLNAMDNILLPYRLCPSLTPSSEVRDRARTLAESVGISRLLRRRPDKLSQGERQRVAICRALITRPKLLLCDEPTGNLDPARSQEAIDLILREADAAGATALVVTHDHSLLGGFARVIELPTVMRPGSSHPEPASAYGEAHA